MILRGQSASPHDSYQWGANMICLLVGAVLLALLSVINMEDHRSVAQARERPYFMPPAERDRLHDQILKQAWAKADLARLENCRFHWRWLCRSISLRAERRPQGRRYRAKLAVRKVWQEGDGGVRATDRLNSEFFKGGQADIAEVYYDTDLSGYLAFDWAYKGLEATAARRSRKASSLVALQDARHGPLDPDGEPGFQADRHRGPRRPRDRQ